jgi:carbon-monoxide dehydrogenase catalytic subunit
VFGVGLPVTGAPVFQDYLFDGLEKDLGGKWDVSADPYELARKMIEHIDKKRKELGIDKARERVLFDMEARRQLEAEVA